MLKQNYRCWWYYLLDESVSVVRNTNVNDRAGLWTVGLEMQGCGSYLILSLLLLALLSHVIVTVTRCDRRHVHARTATGHQNSHRLATFTRKLAELHPATVKHRAAFQQLTINRSRSLIPFQILHCTAEFRTFLPPPCFCSYPTRFQTSRLFCTAIGRFIPHIIRVSF